MTQPSTTTTETTPTPYALGESDGYEQAKDAEREATDGEPLGLVSGRDAEQFDAALLNALGIEQTEAYLGLQLYADGNMTEQGRSALDEYNRGCTDGWNRRASELADDNA